MQFFHARSVSARSLTGVAVAASLALLAGCAGGEESPSGANSSTGASQEPAGSGKVTLLSHDSFALTEADEAAFADLGVEVELVKISDGGTLVNQLILTKDAPLGDVVYGIDNTFATRAIDAGVFTDYASAALPEAAADLRINDGDALTPIDQGDVCLNYDKVWFDEHDLTVPATLEDLSAPQYKDLLVVTNPATSTPGLSFLFATVGEFGQDGYLDFWGSLVDNGLKVVDSWEDAYYTDFSGGGENGPRPIVLSYGSSPAYTLDGDGGSTTASIDASCFRQVEYAGILNGAQDVEAAQQVIDYMVSDDFQAALADTVYMYPVNPEIDLPEDFAKFGALSKTPVEIAPADIDANRDAWIQAWTDKVLG